MVRGGVREKEKGASRKESEKAEGLRCSGDADMQSETHNVLYVLSEQNLKFHEVGIKIYKYASTNIGKYL